MRRQCSPTTCSGPTYDILSTEENQTLTGKEFDDDAEREPHVGEGEPSEDEGEDVVLQNDARLATVCQNHD